MLTPRSLLAAAALLGVLLTGCSNDDPPQENLPDGATLLSEAATAVRDVQSAHVKIETEGEVSSLPLRRAEGDLLRNGDAKGTLQLKQLGTLIEYEFVVLGETIYLKGVTGGWQSLPASVAANLYDPSAILDPDRGIAKVLSTSTEPRTEALETINGKEAYRVAVKVDSQGASALVPGMPPGVTGKIWLDKQTKQIVKAVLSVPSATPGTVTLDVSNIDVPVTVSAP